MIDAGVLLAWFQRNVSRKHLDFAYVKKRLGNDSEAGQRTAKVVDQSVFRLWDVRLAHSPDQAFTGVSIPLGISSPSLHRWAKAVGDQGTAALLCHGTGSLAADHAEIKRCAGWSVPARHVMC